MISPEATAALNILLKAVPENKEFRVSTYVKVDDSLPIPESSTKEKEALSWEVHRFLLTGGFAERTGSAVLLRKGTTPDILLTPDKGVSLRRAGSYEKYYSVENEDGRKKDNQNRQNGIMESLTGVIALWTLIAGISYTIDILKYIIPEFCCPGTKRIMVTVISLAFGLLGYRSLKVHLYNLSKYMQSK